MIRIYFISDRTLTPDQSPARVLAETIEAGVEMVQVREKDLDARDVLDLARQAVGLSGGRTEVYVNGRYDVAVAAGADGVHLPAAGLAAADVRKAAPARLRIGVSTHSVGEARAAEAAGADFITFGPIFETPSKAAYGPPVGLRALHEALAAVALPVYALGGIRPDNVDRVLELPVSGIAVVSAIARAENRGRAVEAFREAARRVRGGVA